MTATAPLRPLRDAADREHGPVYLTLTQFLDRTPQHVEDHLAGSVSTALRAAADRLHEPLHPSAVSIRDHRAVVEGGVEALDGAAIEWDGDDELVAIRVRIPWRVGDPSQGRRAVAASRFVHVLADTVRAAA